MSADTRALDSTFHLAYSHLVQQYQGLAFRNSQYLLMGDSVVVANDPAVVRAAGGASGVEALRQHASDEGLRMTRGWARADADASAPHVALAQAFAQRAQADSAVAVMERAIARPTLNTPGMRLQLAGYQLLADDPRAFATAREAVLRENRRSLREASATERIFGLILGLSIMGSVGNGAELDRMAEAFAEVMPTFPFSRQTTDAPLRVATTGLRIGMTGVATPEQRRQVAQFATSVGRGQSDALLAQIFNSSGSVLLTAYLATRDTVFSSAFRRLSPATAEHSDLDALEALTRGDTAAARRIAQGYTPPADLPSSRFSFAGLRAVARAEVLTAIGNTDWALGYYEALHPTRFSTNSFGDPGFAAYTRSFAARARLYDDRREPTKAIMAWEEFLRRTADGDEIIEPQRREARAALQRLREGARR
jgi:hypothetical protein